MLTTNELLTEYILFQLNYDPRFGVKIADINSDNCRLIIHYYSTFEGVETGKEKYTMDMENMMEYNTWLFNKLSTTK